MLLRGLTAKGPEGSFGGDGKVPYLDDGAGSYIYQNTVTCTLIIGVFYRMSITPQLS